MSRLLSFSKRLKILVILTMLITGVIGAINSPSARAEDVCYDPTTKVFVSTRFGGRQICSTYYVNMPGKWTTPSSVAWPVGYTGGNFAAGPGGFIEFLQNEINLCGNPINLGLWGACSEPDKFRLTASSAIINAMLGANPETDFGSDLTLRTFQGIVAAQTDLNSGSSIWKAAVSAYDGANWIDWNLFMPGGSNAWDNCNLSTAPNYHGRTDTLSIKKGALNDLYPYCNEAVEDFPGTARVDDSFIVFDNQDSTYFRINRRTGGITGDFRPIVGLYKNSPRATVDNVDLASPVDADFHSWIDTSINRAPQEINVIIRRHFYLIKNGVTITLVDVTDTDPSIISGSGQHQRDRTIPIAPHNLGPGDQICSSTTVTQSGGIIDPTGVILTPGPSDTETTCLTLHNKPYLGVYGGDVFAGGGFDAGCTPTSGAINTVTSGLPSVGSGSQLAAFALGSINGLNSAKLRSAGPVPNPPDGLYFANDGINGSFGGSHCITSYPFPVPVLPALYPPGMIFNSTWINMDITRMPDGNYYVAPPPPPDLQMICSSRDGAGVQAKIKKTRHITVYVKGDVLISPCFDIRDTGDFVYETNWSNASEIPSVTIIAEGNIIIEDSVTQLDGNFIAKPVVGRPDSGTINT